MIRPSIHIGLCLVACAVAALEEEEALRQQMEFIQTEQGILQRQSAWTQQDILDRSSALGITTQSAQQRDAQAFLARERAAALTNAAEQTSQQIQLRTEQLKAAAGCLLQRSGQSVDPTQVTLRNYLRSLENDLARLRLELGNLQRQLTNLHRHSVQTMNIVARADSSSARLTVRTQIETARAQEIARLQRESQMRLDALVAELQALRPSLMLPQAQPLSEIATALPLPPEFPPAVATAPSISLEVTNSAPAGMLIVRPSAVLEDPIPHESLPLPIIDMREEVDVIEEPVAPMSVFEIDGGYEFGTPPDAVICAPRAGEVIAAGPLEGYGNVVILEHARGVMSICASLGETMVSEGDEVEAGDALGVAGELRATGMPGFRFELRRGDDMLDAADWLGTPNLIAALVLPR